MAVVEVVEVAVVAEEVEMEDFKKQLQKDLAVNIVKLVSMLYLAWLCVDAKFWLGLIIPVIGAWYFVADSCIIIKALRQKDNK